MEPDFHMVIHIIQEIIKIATRNILLLNVLLCYASATDKSVTHLVLLSIFNMFKYVHICTIFSLWISAENKIKVLIFSLDYTC